jgi:hypothetical protein
MASSEMTEINFLNMVSMLANKYNLAIDWGTSDVEEKKLNFIGISGLEDVEGFCIELENICKENIE